MRDPGNNNHKGDMRWAAAIIVSTVVATLVAIYLLSP
jgi:hypothetical protein